MVKIVAKRNAKKKTKFPAQFGIVFCKCCNHEAKTILYDFVPLCAECYWEYFQMIYGDAHEPRGFIYDPEIL